MRRERILKWFRVCSAIINYSISGQFWIDWYKLGRRSWREPSWWKVLMGLYWAPHILLFNPVSSDFFVGLYRFYLFRQPQSLRVTPHQVLAPPTNTTPCFGRCLHSIEVTIEHFNMDSHRIDRLSSWYTMRYEQIFFSIICWFRVVIAC